MLMGNEGFATLFVAAVGLFASWAVWVSVMIFELKTKIALLKQEIEVLKEVKEVLSDIRDQLRHYPNSHYPDRGQDPIR